MNSWAEQIIPEVILHEAGNILGKHELEELREFTRYYSKEVLRW